jgi:hypothetical protein
MHVVYELATVALKKTMLSSPFPRSCPPAWYRKKKKEPQDNAMLYA